MFSQEISKGGAVGSAGSAGAGSVFTVTAAGAATAAEAEGGGAGFFDLCRDVGGSGGGAACRSLRAFARHSFLVFAMINQQAEQQQSGKNLKELQKALPKVLALDIMKITGYEANTPDTTE